MLNHPSPDHIQIYIDKTSFNERLAMARAAKERLRLEGPAPDYPASFRDMNMELHAAGLGVFP